MKKTIIDPSLLESIRVTKMLLESSKLINHPSESKWAKLLSALLSASSAEVKFEE